MPKSKSKTATTMVLADLPDRNQLRELQGNLAETRDAIAELDLEIETLREELASFEAKYNAKLAREQQQLRRVEKIVQHVERWRELLQRAPEREVPKRARRLYKRRQHELDGEARMRRESRERAVADAEEQSSVVPEPDDRLKSAFRALARRFHPDLARTEEERVRFSELMGRINELYRQGDLTRLQSMEEQAKGGDVDDPEADIAAQLKVLEKRLNWFWAVLQNLREERTDLERSPTCELMRNVEQAAAGSRDIIAEIRGELRERVKRSYPETRRAIRRLEEEVSRFNRAEAGKAAMEVHDDRAGALERIFDPYADKRMVRLGLDELATLRVTNAVREHAGWIEGLVDEQPALLRLILLTYVSELSPFPLAGIETYDDLRTRFDLLKEEEEEEAGALSLERTLVEADELLEFGVRRASEKVVNLGLRFRADATRDAVPVALKSLGVRREFRRVLGILGEQEPCAACDREVVSVPLFCIRGLDELRATVCPRCGGMLRRYWMPKGKDVQAVLNPAFLDFELLVECSFRLGRASVATQFLPMQLEMLSVGDLKKRLHTELFERNRIEVKRGQLQVWQKRRRVAERTPVSELDEQRFSLRFAKGATLSEHEALEILRHRIRTRFRKD